MAILAIMLLLLIAFDPSVALWMIAIAVVVYGGYFIIAGYISIIDASNHPAVIIVITIAIIAIIIIQWWRNGTKSSYDNICSINGKMFNLSKAIELVKQNNVLDALKEVHSVTGLGWTDVKALTDQILQEGRVPTNFAPEYPMIETAKEETTDYLKRGRENLRKMREERVARWINEAIVNDCWYDGSSITAPRRDYWSDGSIKRDRWTGRTFSKGQYFLDSRGYNSTGVKIPPNAKRCPD